MEFVGHPEQREREIADPRTDAKQRQPPSRETATQK